MKKGDIVKLKPNMSLRSTELSGWIPSGFAEQELYTVASDATYQRVGCADEVSLVMKLEELGMYCNFDCEYFDVVLPAGQPDVNKLLEESVMAIAE